MNPVAPYLLWTAVALAVAVAVIVLARKHLHGVVIGLLAAIPFGVLFMIKLRCTLDGSYNCGFMSFEGGFTWHFLPGVVAFIAGWAAVAAILRTDLSTLGKSAAPLLGLWAVVLWEVLPIAVIHPPTHGGPCPLIPLICHDTPLAGRGGLFWWSLPFVLWAGYALVTDALRLRRS